MLFTRSLFATLLLIALTGPASATVMHFLDDASLARQAQKVVRGRVIAQSVVEVKGRLWTDSTVLVLEVLKGKLRVGDRMLVRQPGGERGDVGMRVAGAAQFRPGEEVLLFARWSAGRHYLVGMAQGKYSLYRDAAGKQRAHRDLKSVGFVTRDAQGRSAVRVLDRKADRTLQELRATVRAVSGGAR
jgi:hypothetical protein